MTVLNKVLIGLIFFASIGMFILGTRALKTHQCWQQKAQGLEKELAWERDKQLVLTEGLDSPEVAAREEELNKIGGDAAQGIQQGKQALEEMREEAKLGLRKATLALDEQLVDRGPVWRACRPQAGPETATEGKVLVTVEFPAPHQIQPQTVLWVFDEAGVDQGGRYLGQFVVVGGPPAQELQLQPTVRMTPRELAKLNQSAGRNGATWSLYAIMPSDNHQSLAGLTEDQLKAVLPPETVAEYVTDGQMSTLGDMRQRGLEGNVYRVDANGQIARDDGGLEVPVQGEDEKGKYVRQLRDYEEVFRHAHLVWTEMVDRVNTLTRSVAYLDPKKLDPNSTQIGALQLAQQQETYRQKEKDQLAEDLKTNQAQRDEVVAHLNAVKGTLAALQEAIHTTIARVQGMAGEIAKIQQEATRIIDERTRTMAQAGEAR
jgi:hypothetical protein